MLVGPQQQTVTHEDRRNDGTKVKLEWFVTEEGGKMTLCETDSDT